MTNSTIEKPGPPKSSYIPGAGKSGIDLIVNEVIALKKDTRVLNISLPKDSLSVYTVSFVRNNAPHESATDQLFFDQYTGKQTGANLYKDGNLGSRVRSTFKPVHTGGIFGWPSKVIAFITCVLGVTFLVTGTIMWINRIRKKTKPAIRVAMAANIKEKVWLIKSN